MYLSTRGKPVEIARGSFRNEVELLSRSLKLCPVVVLELSRVWVFVVAGCFSYVFLRID